MICNYNKEQITPTISANQIPAISIRLNLIRHCCIHFLFNSTHSSYRSIFADQIFLQESLEMESYYCIYCNEEVTARQEALLCDGCDKWQHRRCNTGIPRLQYRDAVKSGLEVVWRCLYCSEITDPLAESSRIEEEMDAFDIPPSFGMLVFSLCKIKRSLRVNLIFSSAYRHEFQKRNLRARSIDHIAE